MTLALFAIAAANAPVYFGFASVDLTPPEPLPLGGYTERRDRLMEPGGQPIVATALRLQQGETSAAIVSVELLTVPGSLTREVERRLRDGGFRGALLLCATHTHSAPDSQMLNDRMRVKIPGIAQFKSKWLTWYADAIAQSVLSAHPSRRLDRIELLEGSADVNKYRREKVPGRPDFPDRKVSVIRLRSSTATFDVRHYSAHPTVRSEAWNHTSGDWPAAWSGLAGSPGLFLNGMIGDVAPSAHYGETEAARLRAIGSALVGARLSVVWSSSVPALTVASAPVQLPPATPHPEFAAANRIPAALAASLVASFAPAAAAVTVVAIGEVAIVGVPGEPTTLAGAEIRAAIGARHSILVSFANEWIGYVLAPAEYAQGGYEAQLAFHGADVIQRLAAATKSAFRSFGASERAGRALAGSFESRLPTLRQPSPSRALPR
jgi:hypothetical protein